MEYVYYYNLLYNSCPGAYLLNDTLVRRSSGTPLCDTLLRDALFVGHSCVTIL